MPDVPSPVTSPPRVPGQPYSVKSGPEDATQSQPEHVYDANGGGMGSSDPWPKVQEGGAADWKTGRVTGTWPADGTSDGSAWKQA